MENYKILDFKTKLLERREEVQDHIEILKNTNEESQGLFPSQELSTYDNHPADNATDVFQAQMNNGLRVRQEMSYHEIEDALKRIEKGTYGICPTCGKEIPEERLEILPSVKYCVECAEEIIEIPVTKQNSRPSGEKVIDAPLGRKYLNKREDDENEGMDYLNDLMKYGSSDTPQDMGGYHDYKEFFTNEVDKQGVVDDMDKYSNKDYIRQLPE